jgi:hypothetical protein
MLPILRRLLLLLGVAGLGWAAAIGLDLREVYQTSGYFTAVTGLLAVGLFASTYSIDLAEARRNLTTVVIAITVGVVVKAALIATVMLLAFQEPAYLVLGVAVAQIDPLSVTALRRQAGMSEETKAILFAWASFDDPVTALLTVYLSAVALVMSGRHAESGLGVVDGDGPLALLAGLALNLLFTAGALVLWWLLRLGRRRIEQLRRPGRAGWSHAHRVLTLVLLLGLGAVAVDTLLLLGLALTGLFFRPAIVGWLDRVAYTALLAAAFALGLVLVGGVQLGPGVALGLAAFGAQAAVGTVIAWHRPPADRVYLALSQQNGITAVILALLLEPLFPGTVGIVAPAIVTVTVLHALSNAGWERVRRTRAGRQPDRESPGPGRTAPVRPDPAG